MRRLSAALVVALLVACSSDSKPTSTPASSSAGPAQPGDVVTSAPVSVPDLHGTLLRVRYHSRSVMDADIEVTGMIAIPSTPPPADGYPVVSWAHGTTGIADECAPSRDPSGYAGFANQLLDAGYLVVA